MLYRFKEKETNKKGKGKRDFPKLATANSSNSIDWKTGNVKIITYFFLIAIRVDSRLLLDSTFKLAMHMTFRNQDTSACNALRCKGRRLA